jgi:hypothetical protein
MRISTSIAKRVVLSFAVVALSTTGGVLAPSPSWAAISIFVQFDELGPCGGSQVVRFEGALEATSFRFALGTQADEGLVSGARPVKVAKSRAMQIIAPPGGCSPQLFVSALSGRHLSLKVSFFDPDAGGGFVPLEINADDVFLQGLDLGGAPGQQGQEITTLGLGGRVTITTRSIGDNGMPGDPVSQCWDLKTDRTC